MSCGSFIDIGKRLACSRGGPPELRHHFKGHFTDRTPIVINQERWNVDTIERFRQLLAPLPGTPVEGTDLALLEPLLDDMGLSRHSHDLDIGFRNRKLITGKFGRIFDDPCEDQVVNAYFSVVRPDGGQVPKHKVVAETVLRRSRV